jgi:CheY-like chemotaxis protein
VRPVSGESVVADVRVLVVDDQEPFRRAMESVVQETDGFVVVGAVASGEEVLEAVPRLRPDLVLMDLNLPDINGIEAIRRLRSQSPAPVVFLLSTYEDSDFDIAGGGAATYIAKAAFGPDRLTDARVAARDAGQPKSGEPSA